jgi:hypothetical protein
VISERVPASTQRRAPRREACDALRCLRHHPEPLNASLDLSESHVHGRASEPAGSSSGMHSRPPRMAVLDCVVGPATLQPPYHFNDGPLGEAVSSSALQTNDKRQLFTFGNLLVDVTSVRAGRNASVDRAEEHSELAFGSTRQSQAFGKRQLCWDVRARGPYLRFPRRLPSDSGAGIRSLRDSAFPAGSLPLDQREPDGRYGHPASHSTPPYLQVQRNVPLQGCPQRQRRRRRLQTARATTGRAETLAGVTACLRVDPSSPLPCSSVSSIVGNRGWRAMQSLRSTMLGIDSLYPSAVRNVADPCPQAGRPSRR